MRLDLRFRGRLRPVGWILLAVIAFCAPVKSFSFQKVAHSLPRTLHRHGRSLAARGDPHPYLAFSRKTNAQSPFRIRNLDENGMQKISSLFPVRAECTASLPKRGRLMSRMLRSFCGVLSLFLLTRPAHATSGELAISRLTPPATALLRSIHFPSKRWVRPLVWTTVFVMVLAGLLQEIRVQKRQALDPTSEWSRYAAHPAARGRAVMTLCLRLMTVWFLTKLPLGEDRKLRLRQRSGRVFSDGLLRLGPLYIKMGQIISCQEDLLPSEWMSSMERLQDRVPARSGEAALELAYASVGSKTVVDELFLEFETTPLAAASLGQVHKAVLRQTNETVAVKLQRPYLRSIYDQDLVFLMKIANVMDKIMGKRAQVGGVNQSWTDIFTDAKEILYREIDYRDEAENALRFAKDFGIGKGGTAIQAAAKSKDNTTLPSAANWLRTPHVYKELCSDKVLVMEYVPSVKITNTEAANVTDDEKEHLADSLARAYLRQFTVNLFFSTDPHAGNLGIARVPETQHPRLVFYDFGQACELKPDQAEGILQVIEAIVDMDSDKCVEAFNRMGVLSKDADIEKVRAKVQNNFETGKVAVKRKKLKKKGYKFKDMPATGQSTSSTTAPKDSEVMSYFSLPAEYAFVARALSQMHGVGKSLDPDFDFISSAAPQIVEIKGAGSYMKDEWGKWVQGVRKRVDEYQKTKWNL